MPLPGAPRAANTGLKKAKKMITVPRTRGGAPAGPRQKPSRPPPVYPKDGPARNLMTILKCIACSSGPSLNLKPLWA